MNNRFHDRFNKKGRVLRFERDSGFFVRRADSKRQQNDPVSAASLYWSALERDPKDYDIRLALADVLSDMQRYIDSNHLLIPHMHEDEWFLKEAYSRVGFNFFAMGEYEAAHKCFDRFFELTDEVSERTDVILDALELIDSMADNEPNIQDASEAVLIKVTNEAHECIAGNEYSKAKQLLTSLHKDHPDDDRVTYDLALACMCDKDYEEGLGYIDALLGSKGDSLQLLSLKLIYAQNVNDELMMQSVCNRLASCEPSGPDELLPVMGILLGEGRTELAMTLAKKAYIKTPYDCLANHLLALSYIKQEQYKKAASLYAKLLNIDRNDSIARFYYARCSADEPDFKGIRPESVVQYQIPVFDIMENIKQLAQANSLSLEELRSKWRDDPAFRDIVHWGFSVGEFSLSYSLINMLRIIGDEDAQLLIRESVIDPDTNHNLAHEAMGMLKNMGAQEPYFTFAGGSFLEGRVSLVNLSDWHVPKQYRMIFPRFHAASAGLYDIEVYAAASGIMENFLSKFNGVFPQLDEARSSALSAALEFAACRNSGVEVKDDILDRYGISERRLKNAVDKMVAVLMNADGAYSEEDEE